MEHIIQKGMQIALCGAVLSALVACSDKQQMTRSDAVSARGEVSQEVTPEQAKKMLMRMAQFLAKTRRFSVKLNDNYEVLQDSGQMIEFGESRTIIVDRPNGLHVDIEHSDGEKHRVIYDGNMITAFSPSHNVYAQVPKSGGIDEAVMYFLKDLHMRLPLAALLLERFPTELDRRTLTLDYVERNVINGTPSHHLAGRTETVDYQVWIEEGDEPLPLRVVLTYKTQQGHPAFRAQFSDWNLNPDVDDAVFSFTPPEGATKILFLAQFPHTAPGGAIAPDQTGGQQ